MFKFIIKKFMIGGGGIGCALKFALYFCLGFIIKVEKEKNDQTVY